jgi:hypothetical protein
MRHLSIQIILKWRATRPRLAPGLGNQDRLRGTPIRHPLGKKFNARLGPRAFSSWRRGRHYRATDSPNAVVDGRRVRLNIIMTRQVERLAHGVDVSVRKKRPNVRFKTRWFRHGASQALAFMYFAFNPLQIYDVQAFDDLVTKPRWPL